MNGRMTRNIPGLDLRYERDIETGRLKAQAFLMINARIKRMVHCRHMNNFHLLLHEIDPLIRQSVSRGL